MFSVSRRRISHRQRWSVVKCNAGRFCRSTDCPVDSLEDCRGSDGGQAAAINSSRAGVLGVLDRNVILARRGIQLDLYYRVVDCAQRPGGCLRPEGGPVTARVAIQIVGKDAGTAAARGLGS